MRFCVKINDIFLAGYNANAYLSYTELEKQEPQKTTEMKARTEKTTEMKARTEKTSTHYKNVAYLMSIGLGWQFSEEDQNFWLTQVHYSKLTASKIK